MSFIVVVMIISAVFGLLSMGIAKKKGLNDVFWLVMGLALGPIALVLVSLKKNDGN